MSDDEDDWVKNAMNNDSLVAHLLLRLKHAPRPPRVPDRPPLNIDWTVRQRRSKSIPTQDEDGNNKTATERASPNTPLSWSGATSASGGAPDGFEESSRPAKTTNGSRSKVAAGGETTTTKRRRKKKSIAELREEESSLTKERRNLKNQLAAIRLTFEKQRAANKSLKKIKADLQSLPKTIKAITTMVSTESVTDRPQKMEEDCKPAAISPSDLALITDLDALQHPSQPNGASTIQEVGERDTSFMLPDLNLTFEEASCSLVLSGVS